MQRLLRQKLAHSPGVELLDHLLETFFQLQPQLRTGQPRGCLFLDEIQRIPGWESFVRRVIDTEPIDVVVSGSSAEMLSSEIASTRAAIASPWRCSDGRRELIQVCADFSDGATRQRGLRALLQA